MRKLKYGYLTVAILLLQSIRNIYGQSKQLSTVGESLNSTITSVQESFWDPAKKIFYFCCLILGLVGAFKVYSKWSNGDPDTTKTAAGWIGSLIFAIAVVNIIEAFFN